MENIPYIRDLVMIDQKIQNIYDAFTGGGPVILLGRTIRHAAGFTLLVGQRPLLIIADHYDGAGGRIDARGEPRLTPGGDGAVGGFSGRPGVGNAGSNGIWPGTRPHPPRQGQPVGPGTKGGNGTSGGGGGPGGSITLRCRDAVNVHLSVRGGTGGVGGAGGRGGRGVDGFAGQQSDDGSVVGGFSGTSGGGGGHGGPGGPGGAGGRLIFTSMSAVDDLILDAGGGPGGPGGPGGWSGDNGALFDDPDNPDGTDPFEAPSGNTGPAGSGPGAVSEIVSESDYVARMFADLNSGVGGTPTFTDWWGPFRVAVAEYNYRLYRPNQPSTADNLRIAVSEAAAAFQLQPGNADAQRLQEQIAGFAVPVAGADRVVWKGGGNNALGLPFDLDVQPRFDDYIRAFTGFGALVIQFLDIGVTATLSAEQVQELSRLVGSQRDEAGVTLANATDELAIDQNAQKFAKDEISYARQQVDQVTADIEKAMAEMQQHSFSLLGILGTVGAIAGAVVSVIGAIPTAGASLVALVPAIMTLSSTVLANAEPIAQKLFAGESADTKAVADAYDKVNKGIDKVVKSTESIVNLVKVIDKIGAGSTPDNAKYVALVKKGAELAHDLMLADHRATLSGQRVAATQARLGRAQMLQTAITDLESRIATDANAIQQAGTFAIATAQAKADVLLDFAFRAQRSAEIYTLQPADQWVSLAAATVHPDDARDFQDGFTSGGTFVERLVASWRPMLNLANLQQEYAGYANQPGLDANIQTISLSSPAILQQLRDTHRTDFRIEPDDLPAGHFDIKVLDIAIALIGATSLAGPISCEIRRGGRYEQRRRDGTVAVQLLEPQVSTRPAHTTKLVLADVDFGAAPPLSSPRGLAFWGRGVGGSWTVTIAPGQDEGLVLAGLTELQVWIYYQFLH